MHRHLLILFFLNLLTVVWTHEGLNRKGSLTALENKFEFKFLDYANNIAKWLEVFNDKHLNNSDLGKLIRYNEIKTKLHNMENEGRGRSHKLSLLLLPIIFQVGATSTWLVLTGIMAAKSVAIGMILLIFKIVVSSAKVASFVTAWKLKDHHHHHSEISWPVHHEYHGHSRSLVSDATYTDPDSYSPDVSSLADYKTLPADYPEMEYSESKTVKKISTTSYVVPDSYSADWSPDYNTMSGPYPQTNYSKIKKVNKKSTS